MALDFFAGCVGGAAGLICGHPLDTVKVRLQTQSPDNIKYRGTFHALSTIVKQESIPGLFKGIVSPLYGVAAINALVFGVYGTLRPFIAGPPGNDALWAHFLAGAASGSVQSVISSPMELVKIRMQLNENSNQKSSWGVLKDIFRNEGGLRRGVYKGWATTIAREIPGFGSYFATYELLTTKTGRDIGTFEMLMAGGMSGVVSWVVTYPTDVVKTRIQMDTEGKYKGVADCIKKIYQTEGSGAFTRGLTPAVLRAFPTNAATFTVVTWIMRLGEERRSSEDDLQAGAHQTLSEYLEEWDKSGKFSRDKIYQTLHYTMPQPQFLTMQCFLHPEPTHQNGPNNIGCINCIDDEVAVPLYHLQCATETDSSSSLTGDEDENSQENNSHQSESKNEDPIDGNDSTNSEELKSTAEIWLEYLGLPQIKVCKCTDECVC